MVSLFGRVGKQEWLLTRLTRLCICLGVGNFHWFQMAQQTTETIALRILDLVYTNVLAVLKKILCQLILFFFLLDFKDHCQD